MTAFKLAWLRQEYPAAFEAAAFFLPGAKDFLALRLTGRAVTDPVTATTTGLMDLPSRRWSRELATILDVDPARLPEMLPANAVIGQVLPEAAAHLGLQGCADISVINGCGDAGATTLGSFCRTGGDISLYLGTTGWLARVVPQAETMAPRPVYRLAHPSTGLLIEITPILSAGSATAWARQVFGLSEDQAEAALARADRSPADLLFLPYLAGERSPFIDTEVRGAFLGLDGRCTSDALYYAVLEGVGHAIRANLETIDPDATGRIRLAGGGAKSSIWPRILADVLARAIDVPASAGIATATGAFLLAAEALGLHAPQAERAETVFPRFDRRARTDRLARAFADATSFARGLDLRGK